MVAECYIISENVYPFNGPTKIFCAAKFVPVKEKVLTTLCLTQIFPKDGEIDVAVNVGEIFINRIDGLKLVEVKIVAF